MNKKKHDKLLLNIGFSVYPCRGFLKRTLPKIRPGIGEGCAAFDYMVELDYINY